MPQPLAADATVSFPLSPGVAVLPSSGKIPELQAYW